MEKAESETQLESATTEFLEHLLQERPSVHLDFEGIGSFESKFVFASVRKEKMLEELRHDVIDALQKQGIYVTDKRFTPHVTLFRQGHFRGAGRGSRSGSKSVGGLVSRTDLPAVTSSLVNKITFSKLRGS